MSNSQEITCYSCESQFVIKEVYAEKEIQFCVYCGDELTNEE